MSKRPTGTVTLLLTDIEGSTRLLHSLGERYEQVLADHRRLLRETFAAHGGREVDTQGGAFFVAFGRVKGAVAAAVDAQRALALHPWPDEESVRVRMGIHTGEPEAIEEGYVGLDVHRAARTASRSASSSRERRWRPRARAARSVPSCWTVPHAPCCTRWEST